MRSSPHTFGAEVGNAIAPDLDASIATARGRGRPVPLITTTIPVTAPDPIALFAAAQSLGLEAALWLEPDADRSIVGIGRAWAIEAGGPDRFANATAAWRTLLSDAIVSGAGPKLLGGLGFAGRIPDAGDPWTEFGAASLVLPRFTVTGDGDGGSAALTIAVGPDHADGALRLERQWQSILDHAANHDQVRAASGPALREVDSRPDREAWDRSVARFADDVARGWIEKVVLARRVVFRAAAELDVVAALRHLARTAPESTTFAFARHGVTFLGATPERLLRTTGRSFETVAIAGSAPRGRDAAEDARLAAALLASDKDRAEHAAVVATMRGSLDPIVETLDVADRPAVLPLRHVQHLMTPIRGRLREDAGLLTLAGRLHPTAAVGGAPREAALALITEHEGFERGWYAGPIGWLGADGDGELMVALRCALVSGAEATLFAGCGIVADSDPATEWEESRLKLRTMTAALGD